MQDFVSTRWIHMAGLLASMSIICALFVPQGVPWMAWMGLVAVGLSVSAVLWLRVRRTRIRATVPRSKEIE